jgi:hypothetical protein
MATEKFETVEIAFKGAQRTGAASREFDVDVWKLWQVCDAAQRVSILSDWFGRFASVATKDMALPTKDADGNKLAYTDEQMTEAESARLDAIAALVDAANSGESATVTATFFAPGKRAAGGGGTGREFSAAEKSVIAATKVDLQNAMEAKGLVAASGKRGFVAVDYMAAAAAHEKLKGLVRAKGDGYIWRDGAVLDYALARDADAVKTAQAKLDAFDL